MSTLEDSPFLPDGRQWAWNSSTLGPAKECKRKYYYKVILGLQQKSYNADITFGGHYARALEQYHIMRAKGWLHANALGIIVGRLLCGTWDREECETCNGSGFIGDGSVCSECTGGFTGPGKPWDSQHPTKTRETLVRSVIWYLDQFENDPCHTVILDERPAVELPFRFQIADDIWLTGHIDRLIEFAGDHYVQDQKAQPISEKILTPTGWRQIGEIAIGDKVYGRDGKETVVIALFPKGKVDIYNVYFNDGTLVRCAIDHLWTISNQMNAPWRTVDMNFLLDKIGNGWEKFHVPLCEPIQHEEQNLQLDPYVLGVLLGDGYLGGGSIALSTSYDWLAESVGQKLPDKDIIKKVNADNYSWTISGGATLAAIRDLGLKNKLSKDKFVPEQYLLGSVKQRQDLLRGLLITDGTWDKHRRKFDSTSKQLVEAVCTLVRSLGGNARYHKRTGVGTGWRVSLRLKSFPSGLGKKYIIGIIKGGFEEAICIKVDNKEGLYVTTDYTVTHNTTGATLGSYYFKRYTPDNQISLYAVAADVVWKTPVKGVMIDAAQIAVGFTRFERGFAFRAPDQTSEWLHDAEYHIKETWRAAEAGWPMNDSSCHKYGGCEFRDVCSKSPSVRDAFLNTGFVKAFRNPLGEH